MLIESQPLTLFVQIVPALNAYDGMFPVGGLVGMYKSQLTYATGAEIFEAAQGCGCIIS